MNYFNNKIKKPALKIPSTLFTLLLALYFVGFFNLPVLIKAIKIIHPIASNKIGFTLSIPILLIVIFNLFFTVLSIKPLEKIFFVILILVSSMISYAAYHYGTIFDVNMIVNILRTDYHEAVSYVNIYSVGWFILSGILPSIIIILLIDITHAHFARDILEKIIAILLSLLIIVMIVGIYYKDYSIVRRSNDNLNRMIVPLHFFYSADQYIQKNYWATPPTYKQIGTDAKNVSPHHDNKNNLLIFVVGETARSMNYQINGYHRETNLYTRPLPLISFKNVTSCGTNTAVSLPCMFANFSRTIYSISQAEHQDNLLDVLKHAGLNVLWVDNNAGCYQACQNITTVKIEPKKNQWCDGGTCVDEALLMNLQQQINSFRGKDSVIVLHAIGSHGPAYYKRFPRQHEHFRPSCLRSDIQNCTREELLNTYDNSILYTDFVLDKIIKLMQHNNQDWHTSVIYVSDHGESLGENGIYLHGLPYAFAPPEQTHIPLITWFSRSFIKNKHLDIACLTTKANVEHYSHTNIFSSVLGLMDIKTKEYNKKQDMFSACRRTTSLKLSLKSV